MSQQESNSSYRAYCAGPLFNRSEREEMTAIADCLCRAGYEVYLPHRDGMEFRRVLDVMLKRGWTNEEAGQVLHSAIFALDIYQLIDECQVVVWNLNGRTPDEGAVSEAAMAWMLGKPLLAFTDDVRSLIAGRLNPLVAGLVEFQTVDRIRDIPLKLAEQISRCDPPRILVESLPEKVQLARRDGRRLWVSLRERCAQEDDEQLADVVAELFAPVDEPSTNRT